MITRKTITTSFSIEAKNEARDSKQNKEKIDDQTEKNYERTAHW